MPRDTVGRLVGKMAHPLNRPYFDHATACDERIRHCPTPRDYRAADEAGGSWFKDSVQPAWIPTPHQLPTFTRTSLKKVPSSARASIVHRCCRGGHGRPYAGQLHSQPRPLRGNLRARGARQRHRGRRGVSATLRRRHRSNASMGARRRRLLPWIVGAEGDGPKRRAPVLGRWKMFDDLRRTLIAPISVAALLVGWSLEPIEALVWTLFICADYCDSTSIVRIDWLRLVVQKRVVADPSAMISGAASGWAFAESGFRLATLVHQGSQMVDAIVRTLWRLAISREHLRRMGSGRPGQSCSEMTLLHFYRWMGISVAVAVLGGLIALLSDPLTALLGTSFPNRLGGSASTGLFGQANPNPISGPIALSDGTLQKLRLIARRTWHFFERFVTAEEHAATGQLSGTRFRRSAHRTSPTNIGLYLLSVVAARDFGWLGLTDMIERLEATLGTMNRLHRFRGHFYNWYDTTDLRPLDPQYVSTVDSGNLAGHLIALANACDEATTPCRQRSKVR